MKVYRNTKEIEKRDRTGRRLSMAGLVILFIGLLASFVPTWYPPGSQPESAWGIFMANNWALLSFGALPLGFLAASLGSYYITRYARRRWPGTNQIARPDELLERSLKGLDDRHSLFVYSLPVGYVLLAPFGLLTLAVRSDKGRVTVSGDRWRERWNAGRILTLFAREGVGNPPGELADQERKLRALLAKAPPTPEGTTLESAPIEGAVVFLNSDTYLDLQDPTTTVLRADQIKDHVRKRAREVKAQPALMRAVNDYLASVSGATATAAAEPKAAAPAAAGKKQ
jgi:hypothetical protein